jgi:hypothetical protein
VVSLGASWANNAVAGIDVAKATAIVHTNQDPITRNEFTFMFNS